MPFWKYVDAKFDLGRAGNRKREKNDIGINSIRMGNVVGIHGVYISAILDTTLKHEAHSRAVLPTVLWRQPISCLKPAGLYSMEDMSNEKVAIYGYGNLGKGVELAVNETPDVEVFEYFPVVLPKR